MKFYLRILHIPSGILLVDGLLYKDIKSDGEHFFIEKSCQKSNALIVQDKLDFSHDKLFFNWVELVLEGNRRAERIAWQPFWPNPLKPHFNIGMVISRSHPDIGIQRYCRNHDIPLPIQVS